MKKRLTVLLAVFGLLATSGIALAQEETEDGDTVFNFGYDTENGVLVWNTSPTDGTHDCSLGELGELNTTYEVRADGLVYVTDLTDSTNAPVEFPPRPEEEVADDLEPATDPLVYDVESECGLSGDEVAGPNGQVNHGMFMKLFNSTFDGRARGCVNRHLAQSDLGKGDQQIQVPDVDPEDEPVATGDTGVITFETVITTCLHERDEEDDVATLGNGNGNGNGNGRGRGGHGGGKPPWAGGPGGPGGGD